MEKAEMGNTANAVEIERSYENGYHGKIGFWFCGESQRGFS